MKLCADSAHVRREILILNRWNNPADGFAEQMALRLIDLIIQLPIVEILDVRPEPEPSTKIDNGMNAEGFFWRHRVDKSRDDVSLFPVNPKVASLCPV